MLRHFLAIPSRRGRRRRGRDAPADQAKAPLTHCYTSLCSMTNVGPHHRSPREGLVLFWCAALVAALHETIAGNWAGVPPCGNSLAEILWFWTTTLKNLGWFWIACACEASSACLDSPNTPPESCESCYIRFLSRKTHGSPFILMITPAAQHVVESPITWYKTTVLRVGLYVQIAIGENWLHLDLCVFLLCNSIFSQFSKYNNTTTRCFISETCFEIIFIFTIYTGLREGQWKKTGQIDELTTTLLCLFVPMTLPWHDGPWRECHMRTAWRNSHIHLWLKPEIRQIRHSSCLQVLFWVNNVFQRIKAVVLSVVWKSLWSDRSQLDRFGIYLSQSALSHQRPIILTLQPQNCERHN